MKDFFEIRAESRLRTGRGASRRLCKQGRVPAVVYGGGVPTLVSVDHNDLLKRLAHEAFFSHVLQLDVEGTVVSVVLKDLHRHPARPVILHADFQRVSADMRIKMRVPLHFVNEDVCPGLKRGGTITRSVTEVVVVCLPKDLPEFILVDMGSLGLGHSIHVGELVLPQGVQVVGGVLGAKAPVVSVHGSRGVEVAVAAVPTVEVAAAPKVDAKAVATGASKGGSKGGGAKGGGAKGGAAKGKS